MGSVADVSATFFLEVLSGAAVSTRRIKGRTYLCGFGIIPTYKIDSTTTLATGTVRLENLNAAGDASSGDVLMEFPVIVGSAYAVAGHPLGGGARRNGKSSHTGRPGRSENYSGL